LYFKNVNHGTFSGNIALFFTNVAKYRNLAKILAGADMGGAGVELWCSASKYRTSSCKLPFRTKTNAIYKTTFSMKYA